MKIRMTVGFSGPAINLRPGDEAEFSAAEAMRLVAAGFAVPVAVVERAVVAKPVEQRKHGKG